MVPAPTPARAHAEVVPAGPEGGFVSGSDLMSRKPDIMLGLRDMSISAREGHPPPGTGRDRLAEAFAAEFRRTLSATHCEPQELSPEEQMSLLRGILAPLGLPGATPLLSGKHADASLRAETPAGPVGFVWYEQNGGTAFWHLMKACRDALAAEPALRLVMLRRNMPSIGWKSGMDVFRGIFVPGGPHRFVRSDVRLGSGEGGAELADVLAAYHSLECAANEHELRLSGSSVGPEALAAMAARSGVLRSLGVARVLGLDTPPAEVAAHLEPPPASPPAEAPPAASPQPAAPEAVAASEAPTEAEIPVPAELLPSESLRPASVPDAVPPETAARLEPAPPPVAPEPIPPPSELRPPGPDADFVLGQMARGGAPVILENRLVNEIRLAFQALGEAGARRSVAELIACGTLEPVVADAPPRERVLRRGIRP